MAKIKILSEKMAKMISAGEVVEKPASIVKELVENSIDAGATSITVEIVNGGQTSIVISDNGHGMNKDDIYLSILPHATSKIEFPEDLNAILTLGFRGEALSSISAVSEVSIMSKTAEQEYGYLAKVDEGIITSCEEISCEVGTRIQVSNLFYNTPARLKFLRKPKSDEADITDYLEKLIMSYSNVSFKYYIDGKIKYNTTGSGLLDNIYTIYGKEILDSCIKIDQEKSGYHLHGYIGKPSVAKPNRNYQTMLVCGRYVKSPMISTAISNAYENYLMKGRFPFYVLFLDLPAESLDVNIHPNKLEVKFEKPNFVYGFITEAISQALLEISYEKTITLVQEEPPKTFEQPKIQADFGISYNQNFDNEIVLSSNNQPTSFDYEENTNNITDELNHDIIKNNINLEIKTNLSDQSVSKEKMTFKQINLVEKLAIKNNSEQINVIEYQIIGRVFETYIILEAQDELYLIDQHAAHERILFDKFTSEIQNNEIVKQDMLFPYTFEVKDIDFIKLQDILPLLNEYGFDIYEFGENSFKIDSVPVLLQNINLKDFVALLLDDNFYDKKSIDIIRDKIASHACKSAVKAGDKLTDNQIEYIVDKISDGLLICPHGRPFVIKLKKSQLEKWFGRIV